MLEKKVFQKKQKLEMFFRTIRIQFWQHRLKILGQKENCIFFSKWFFPKLSTEGVECLFDNSAEK